MSERGRDDGRRERALAHPASRQAPRFELVDVAREIELYFSILSPDDWSGAPPHPFQGSYRLENDLTWSPAERSRERPDVESALAQLRRPDER